MAGAGPEVLTPQVVRGANDHHARTLIPRGTRRQQLWMSVPAATTITPGSPRDRCPGLRAQTLGTRPLPAPRSPAHLRAQVRRFSTIAMITGLTPTCFRAAGTSDVMPM
jgi:hypothetical protein